MNYEEMIATIQKAKEDYYSTGKSALSDYEYDRLVEQAEKLGYIETVGSAPVKDIKTIEHEHPMLSLDKCHTPEEVAKFMGNKDVIAMYKADGLTCSATYIDGILTRLETRGNGAVGNDVMFHSGSIENLPKIIDKPGKYVIDGECVILISDFEKLNQGVVESERYSHPRNLAAGSLNQLDPMISKQRHLRFYGWDVIEGGIYPNSLKGNLEEARDLGFDTVGCVYVYSNSEYLAVVSDINEAIEYLRKKASEERFPIDGIVFKFSDIGYGKSLGSTGHHPKNARAYKFQDDCYPTKLRSVTWQIGKTSQLTPVANFDPVDCNGVILEKASLHNISIMKQLGLTNDCTCYVKRCNDIIPKVDSVEYDGDGEIEIPKFCPVCNAPTAILKENQSEVLYCTNDSCPGKLLGVWKTFVSKQGMDVDGLSEQTLEKFLRLNYLTNKFRSLYDLYEHKADLYKLDGFGKKSIDNLLAAIEASKSVDLQHFLVAFSIEGVSTGQAKILSNHFGTFDRFKEACDNGYDFSQLPGFGKILSASIKNWWVNNDYQMLDISQVVHFKEEEFMNRPEGDFPLAGKNFVITGKVNHFANRDAIKAEIERLGGNVSGSVSKNTDYLINNDKTSTSSKNLKAKELGVDIISEEDFLEMVEK